MNESDEILRDFLAESREGLDRVENDLVVLENDPGNLERLGSIFRALHTLKGNSTFFQFVTLRHLAHAGEELLGRLRSAELSLTPTMADALLNLVDTLRQMLKSIEDSGREGDRQHEDLVETLARLAGPAAADGDDADDGFAPTKDFSKGREPAPQPHHVKNAPDTPPGDLKTVVRGPSRLAAISVPVPEPAPATPEHEPSSVSGAEARTADEAVDVPSGIRVDVDLLDRLMNLVGELVLTRNQLVQATNRQSDRALGGIAQRLNLVTADLQEGVLKTRMRRIGGVWQRFPRLVRDLSRECGKDVALEMHGSDTELDRTLLDAIADPLVHILRNAIDHGIEPPDIRRARGKPSQGRVRVRAYHESGQVLIEMSDDGAGINPERVRTKLVERGLVSTQQATSMSLSALLNSIFLPGFSTADKITHVSGRGVGMDVVRTNIERCGGTVDIESAPGVGTTFRIRLPLTLAITSALLVSSAGRRYAIPQVNLVELFSLEPEEAALHVERVRDAEVYRLRGKLLPLVRLDQQLGGAAVAGADQRVNIAVLRVNDTTFGLIVDRIDDGEEIVVKPLGATLRGLPLYAGATILGDGQVALILDVLGLARRTGILSEKSVSAADEQVTSARRLAAEPLLLCEVAGGRRVAVPLKQVTCLEEFAPEAVERLVGREVVRYRGGLLPLVHLAHALGLDAAARPGARLQVIVANSGAGRTVGVVVERILDVAEQPETTLPGRRHELLRGSTVIHDLATDLVDLHTAVHAAELVESELADGSKA